MFPGVFRQRLTWCRWKSFLHWWERHRFWLNLRPLQLAGWWWAKVRHIWHMFFATALARFSPASSSVHSSVGWSVLQNLHDGGGRTGRCFSLACFSVSCLRVHETIICSACFWILSKSADAWRLVIARTVVFLKDVNMNVFVWSSNR